MRRLLKNINSSIIRNIMKGANRLMFKCSVSVVFVSANGTTHVLVIRIDSNQYFRQTDSDGPLDVVQQPQLSTVKPGPSTHQTHFLLLVILPSLSVRFSATFIPSLAPHCLVQTHPAHTTTASLVNVMSATGSCCMRPSYSPPPPQPSLRHNPPTRI